MKIDGIGFNPESVKKLSLEQFIEQYKDQFPKGTKEADWLNWLKEAYKKLNPVETKKKGTDPEK